MRTRKGEIPSLSAVKPVTKTRQSVHQIPEKPSGVGVPTAASSVKSSAAKLFPEPAAENITPTKKSLRNFAVKAPSSAISDPPPPGPIVVVPENIATTIAKSALFPEDDTIELAHSTSPAAENITPTKKSLRNFSKKTPASASPNPTDPPSIVVLPENVATKIAKSTPDTKNVSVVLQNESVVPHL